MTAVTMSNEVSSSNTESNIKQQRQEKKGKKEKINWIVRPTTLDDHDDIAKLLNDSYATLLSQDYDTNLLQKALPDITKPKHELLTCGTWYIVLHPDSNQVVGCGGWSYHLPRKIPSNDDDKNSANDTVKDDNKVNNSQQQQQQKEKQTIIPHLRHFATHPNALRMGVGRAIWDRCWTDIQQSKQLFGSNTILEVLSTITGQSFYQSFGFEPVQNLPLPIDEDYLFPCILMRRVPT